MSEKHKIKLYGGSTPYGYPVYENTNRPYSSGEFWSYTLTPFRTKPVKYFGFSKPRKRYFCWGGTPLTDPYIIRIVNSGAAPASNVVLLDAANRLRFTAGDSYGNSPEIHLSGATPNVNYRMILQEVMQQPFTSAMIQLSGGTGDITQPLSVTAYNARGIAETRAIVPVIDPMQVQTQTVQNMQRFKVDGFTSITVPMVAGNSTTMLYIYPLENTFARSFTGESSCKECETCPYRLRFNNQNSGTVMLPPVRPRIRIHPRVTRRRTFVGW